MPVIAYTILEFICGALYGFFVMKILMPICGIILGFILTVSSCYMLTRMVRTVVAHIYLYTFMKSLKG